MDEHRRDIGRAYLSGSLKRKLKEEKNKKETIVVEKSQKITSFFNQRESEDLQPGESSNSQNNPNNILSEVQHVATDSINNSTNTR